MTERRIERVLDAQMTPEGEGVVVYRTIGTRGLSVLDPFLLLDEFVIAADAEGAGFPDHPHRGFETVTYMLSGRIEHADTAGNRGVIGPGAAQWMTAGSGLIHSEMPRSEGTDVHGLQLWVNLRSAALPGYRSRRCSTGPAQSRRRSARHSGIFQRNVRARRRDRVEPSLSRLSFGRGGIRGPSARRNAPGLCLSSIGRSHDRARHRGPLSATTRGSGPG